MAEQPMDDIALERALGDLGAHLAYPPTPDLAPRVRARLIDRPSPRPPFWLGGALVPRPLALALLALVLLAGAMLAVSPEARLVVAERLGLRAVSVEHVPALPTRSPSPTGVGAPLGLRLNLGEITTLDAAKDRVDFAILQPTLPELGAPDEVYVSGPRANGQVALVYRARAGLPPAAETGVGLLLLELQSPPGSLNPSVLGKGIGPETRVEEVVLPHGRGLWIEGAPHLLFLRDLSGQVRQETVRLAGNVLLWEQGGLTLRLEGAVQKDQALQIATSVR